ncbi:Armadillo-type fold [Sesbania bispinosa]|nr:Armadillo-type fold [Sesbania bispinosa]
MAGNSKNSAASGFTRKRCGYEVVVFTAGWHTWLTSFCGGGFLRNLAKFAEIRQNFTEENAVVVLLAVASSGTVLACENAIECLANLISEDEKLRVSMVKEGGVECLRNFWDSSPQVQSLEVAVEVLRHLASSAPIAEVLVAEGFVERVMGVGCGGFVESVGVFPF